MSIFGSLMGDFEEDPFFGAHSRTMRQMNHMMSSFFSDPFGDMMGGMSPMGYPSIMGASHMGHHVNQQMMPAPRRNQRPSDMMSFGFPNMNQMFAAGGPNMGNCHSYSSSTMVSMSTGPDGRPQVYQSSSSTRTAPGGIRETKKAVADSRSGTKKMAIGHHIGERGHVIEREHNLYSGEQEERQDFINLEEENEPLTETAEEFNREWESKTRRAMGGVAIEDVTDRPSSYRRGRDEPPLLALPPAVSSSSRSRARLPALTSTPSTSTSTSNHERSRKRDHDRDSSSSSSRKASKQQRSRHN